MATQPSEVETGGAGGGFISSLPAMVWQRRWFVIIPIVSVAQVQQTAEKNGVPKAEADALADDYGDAQLQGLKRAIGAVGIFALLSFWFTRGLPARPVAGAEAKLEPAQAVSP